MRRLVSLAVAVAVLTAAFLAGAAHLGHGQGHRSDASGSPIGWNLSDKGTPTG